MTCEPTDIVYFLLGTGNFEFLSTRKVIWNFGETFCAVLHTL